MKYFLGGLGIIGLIVIILVIVFSGGSSDDAPKEVVPGVKVSSYSSSNAIVRSTVDGRIVGNEAHRAIRISVAKDKRSVEVIQGYDGSVLKSAQFANTQASYDVFLRALEGAGFSKSKTATTSDEVGLCSQGNRYIYEIIEVAESKQRLWASSCDRQGTFAGQGQTVRTLFQDQIPDYSTFVSGVQL